MTEHRRKRKPPELPPIDRFPSLEPGRSTKDYARDSQAPFKPLVTRPPIDELLEDDDASLPPLPRKTSSRMPLVIAALLAVLFGLVGAIFVLS